MKNPKSLAHRFEMRKFHKVNIALQTFTLQILSNCFFREKHPALFWLFTDFLKILELVTFLNHYFRRLQCIWKRLHEITKHLIAFHFLIAKRIRGPISYKRLFAD